MQANWNDNQPIYRQLKDKVIAAILDRELKEGDPLPSVRQVSADFQLNPITVSKAYQELVDQQIIEKRRGIGMFVKQGARDKLLADERHHFLTNEWPMIQSKIIRLGFDTEVLLKNISSSKGDHS
jgi:GntR family transcriptional regulator